MTQIKKINVLTTLTGCGIFVSLYIVATFFYPGGSQVDKNAVGFSWINNYWCNLLNEKAINGAYNPSRFIALPAMIILCITLALFWVMFPVYAEMKYMVRLCIQVSAIISMSITLFLFTQFHDMVINIACSFGLIAIVGTFYGLLKMKWYKLFLAGLFNVILIIINNILYYNAGLRIYLPIVQKISFLYFLCWICLISINFYKNPPTTNLKNLSRHEF